jgi:hypothetical protein
MAFGDFAEFLEMRKEMYGKRGVVDHHLVPPLRQRYVVYLLVGRMH